MSENVTVTICGRRYTLVPGENDANLEQIAAQVDEAMTATLRDARVTPLDAAVLTAVNAMDAAVRQQGQMDSIRSQLMESMEEQKRLRQELADTRRELTRLKNGKKNGK